MRRQWLMMSLVMVLACAGFTAQSQAADAAGSQYVGTWLGGWEGAGGAGKFDLTLQRDGNGAVGGGVAVTSDSGNYTAKLRDISFQGNKLTAKYDYPPQEGGEITLTATFDAGTATGTWALGAKGQAGGAMAEGTWKVTKK